jgi:hypothetical protein
LTAGELHENCFIHEGRVNRDLVGYDSGHKVVGWDRPDCVVSGSLT